MNQQLRLSRWPHRWAWLLACTTFPLLWVGGLITTTDAGMAVPDWPNTYGQNMFLYPWSTWFLGPWDLFVEHGHRLLATVVGMFTIIFLVIVWRCEEWRPLRPLAVAALLLVILQGVLGGLRVEINERYLALVHGSVGPLFFAFTAALVVLTKPTLQSAKGRFRIGLTAIPLLLFCQLVFGATLRHTPEEGSPWAFGLHVQSHLAMAAVVVVSLWITAIHAKPRGVPLRLAWAMALLVLAQVGLGIATWYSKYGLPDWAESLAAGTMHASTAGGWTETNTVTAHSAVGAMLLALAVARATWIVSRPQDEEEEEEEERGSSQE